MRKLIVTEFVSIDGVIQAPGGEPGYKHSGWTVDFHGPEQLQYKLDEVLEAEALLLGRKTYEGFFEAWSVRDGEFADKMNGMPKYVISSTLSEPLDWNNSSVLRGDVAEEVARLKEGDGGPILVAGSASLVRALMEHDLVDEYRLMVFPVVLGSGQRMFPDDAADRLDLERVDTQAFGDTGVAVHTYRSPTAART